MEEARSWTDRAIRRQIDLSNLSAEREHELLQIVRTSGDEQRRQSALTELWESHSKLVVSIASRYRYQNVDLLDLIGAGHLGLYAAIDRFDPDRFESRLSSYAIGWIRWYIQDYVSRNSGPVRLPGSNAHRQLMQLRGRLLAEARRSCLREQVEPTDSELWDRIGRRIGMPADEVARSMRLMHGGSLSLHADNSDEPGAVALEHVLADDAASPEDDVILRLDHAKARKRITTLAQELLGERERIVFMARCMNDSDDVARLDSLAAQFGVSRERIYQLEASAKRKIATALTQEGYGDFARDGATFRMPQVRAKRRAAPLPLRKDSTRTPAAAQS
ncbi:MAG TPA: sigma-70 family RNA polymerase sigma factor [Acetobacteraceae bacterium]|jgi:RNA polymerase sigma-32 factor|nr:sigma-70 family RNA polymerase sigma factor [Acetobacteraceae bacterium]